MIPYTGMRLESELSPGHEAGMLNNQVMIKKLISVIWNTQYVVQLIWAS